MTNEKGCPKFGLSGDNREPWEADFYGERWLVFDRATIELGDTRHSF